MNLSFPLTPGGFYRRGIPRLIASDAVEVEHTGTITETTLKTIVVPANSMGANGYCIVRIAGQHTNNANNKTYRVRFGGTSVGNNSATTSATAVYQFVISNVNATNSQKTTPANGLDSTSSLSFSTSSIDTTQDVTILVQGTLANSADSIAIADVKVITVYKA